MGEMPQAAVSLFWILEDNHSLEDKTIMTRNVKETTLDFFKIIV